MFFFNMDSKSLTLLLKHNKKGSLICCEICNVIEAQLSIMVMFILGSCILPGGLVQCIKSRQKAEQDIINSFCICWNSDKPDYCETMNLSKGRKYSTLQKLYRDWLKISLLVFGNSNVRITKD